MENQHSLKAYNTFGIDVYAKEIITIHQTQDLEKLFKNGILAKDFIVLGSGSNVLITKDITCPVLLNRMKGISIISESDNHVIVEAMGGEKWHSFVQYCISKNWGGVENLSLIPGTVGAAPMQNIGAYGVEIKDIFHSLTAFFYKEGEEKTFFANDCHFAYRDSVFKNSLKNKCFITSVQFKLSKYPHQLNTGYGAITSTLKSWNIENPTIKDVSNAVISIRSSKLPDPKKLGNSGSFFKNPILSSEEYVDFSKKFPTVPAYPQQNGVKIAAGWLIEQAGFKGVKYGETGAHFQQALVLVNYGKATGEEVLNMAKLIQAKIYDKFGIQLQFEVNII